MKYKRSVQKGNCACKICMQQQGGHEHYPRNRMSQQYQRCKPELLCNSDAKCAGSKMEHRVSFSVALKEKPATHRGILTTVASEYELLGFLSPYILTGKPVLQEMCKCGVGCDEPIPPALEIKWKAWLCDLENLKKIEIPRCLVPENFGKVKKN